MKEYFKERLNNYYCEGCSEDELKEIEIFYNNLLPKIYIDFLRFAGRQFSNHVQFMWAWRYKENNDKRIKRYITFSGKELKFKKSYVCFYADEYRFGFFDTDDGEDPPIYWYSSIQAENYFAKIADSFIEFIGLLIDEEKLFPMVYTYDMVLFKELLRDKLELKFFEKENLKFFEKIEIPKIVLEKIEHDYHGLEKEMAKKIIFDLSKEKAKYIFHNPNFLFEAVEKIRGDFSKLGDFYFVCIKASNEDLSSLLTKFLKKIVL